MTCLYGSQKQANAVEFLNVNEIGAICVIIGAEGALCRLLDLLPDFVAQIMSRDFNSSTALNVFESMLKTVAKKTVGLIYDELTGKIDVSEFCQNAPPTLPEDITYQDVYAFFAEVVPILNFFFEFNDIVTGNETKLLDKIIGFWLYQKWFENCECTPKPPDAPPDPPAPVVLFPKCPAGYTRARASNDFGIIKKNSLGETILYNNVFVFECEFVIIEFNDTQFVTPPELGYADGQGYFTNDVSVEVIKESDPTDSYNTVNGVRVPKGTLPTYAIPPCVPIPPPPPPPDFCSIYPNDPLCFTEVLGCTDANAVNYNPDANTDDGSCIYCESIDVEVVEFDDCGLDRITKTVNLFNSGGEIDVEVIELDGCGSDRIYKTVQLYDCSTGQSFDCTSLQGQFEYYGTSDAQFFKDNGYDMAQALADKLAELADNQDYLDHPECVDQFNQFYTDAFNAVANTP